MISISIDVKKLDKTRFKEVTRRDGSKALFCDLILLETNSEYGDYLVKQSKKKDEQVELPILGNGKILGRKQPGAAAKPQTAPASTNGSDDVPF